MRSFMGEQRHENGLTRFCDSLFDNISISSLFKLCVLSVCSGEVKFLQSMQLKHVAFATWALCLSFDICHCIHSS